MAKDDYDVLVFIILAYLYGCLKGKAEFNESVLLLAVGRNDLDDAYWFYVLRSISDAGLIEGYQYTKAWGNVCIPLTDLSACQITPAGIAYIRDDGKMQKVREYLIAAKDVIATLLPLIF